MSAPNVLAKNFGNFKGLDTRSSDLERPDGYCSDMLNALVNKAGVLSKKKGYQQKSLSSAGRGMSVFANLDLDTNLITEEIVAVGTTLYKKQENSLIVTYTGAAVAYMSILFVDTEYVCSITVDQTEVLNFSLGTGRDEASPVTITILSAAIDALADFTSSVSGTASVPAAYLDAQEYILLSPAVAESLTAHSFVAVNSPQATMFTNTQAHINDNDFINASMVNAQNVMYIGTGYDDLMKYDGQNLYKAGMPTGVAATISATADVTTINNSALKYLVVYYQKDAKGNIVEGIASAASNALNISNDGISVVLTNILAASTFNTNCAQVDGAQVSVNTITVDASHTLKVGDTAYFYDSVSSAYVEREVTAIAATTVTIAGAAVTVADNAIISNNLRISLYRNVSAGTTYSLVTELPNNSFTANQTYVDLIPDASLGAEYIVPIKPHGLPPRGRFLNYYRSQLFIADNLNTVNYSDIDSPEYFPPGDNGFDVYTNRGDTITGLGSLPNLFFVFKGKSIHAASGDFAEDSFRRDQVNKGEIGCVAHHTIQEVNGSLFFLSEKGVFSISDSAVLTEVSKDIEPEFTKPGLLYNKKKAVALNWLFQDLYLVMVPTEASTAGAFYLDSENSKVFAYDYSNPRWYTWDNINALGGMVLYENVCWFNERRYSTVSGTVMAGIYRFNNTGTYLDYIDHDAAINFSYSTLWEAGGQPSLYKKFLRLKMYSLDGDYRDGEIIPFSVDVAFQFNYIPNDIGTTNLDFTGGGFGYGDDAYSDDAYGSSNLLEVVKRCPATKCRSFRMIFTNNELLENILISGYELELAVPFQNYVKE